MFTLSYERNSSEDIVHNGVVCNKQSRVHLYGYKTMYLKTFRVHVSLISKFNQIE